MKRRVRFFIPFLVIVAIAVLGIVYNSSKNTTFKEMVLDKLNLNEISSIEDIKYQFHNVILDYPKKQWE